MNSPNPNRTTVIVIGGGLAGLAAATALADRNVSVTLLESRPRLGGRASSFVDPHTGEEIDNCQHVAMGCCTNFNAFCRQIGIQAAFRTEKTLYFISPSGKVIPFCSQPLPSPLHLAWSFARIDYLSWPEKLTLARHLRELAHSPPVGATQTPSPRSSDGLKQPNLRAHPGVHNGSTRSEARQLSSPVDSTAPHSRPVEEARTDGSIDEWLTSRGVSDRVRDRFWHVVLVSALSEDLNRISVEHARKVLVDGFLASREAWQVQIPREPLSQLYGGAVTDWLTARGATVRTSAGVESLGRPGPDRFVVTLRNGERLESEMVVVAVRSSQVRGLLAPEIERSLRWVAPFETAPFETAPGEARRAGGRRGLPEGGLPVAPISSVHLWFDRPVTSLPHAVFVDRTSQWMFNRTVLQGVSNPDRWYYQVVISASRQLQSLSQQEVIDMVLGEFADVWPAARDARCLHARVITEHAAVFSTQPGIESLRPEQMTDVPGLFLAGDWTSTGWPATMEGAVRSGYLAAEGVLAADQRPERILVDDLSPGRLARWLYRL